MSKKILVIDDDPSMLKLAKYNLEKEGYDVVTAASGSQGLQVAREENPDLLVVDVLLPGMDGFTVCRLLRYDHKFKHLPIIFLTGRISDEHKKLGEEVGANEYLTKPYRPDVLLEKVKGLLGEPDPAGLKKEEKSDEH